MRREQIIRDLAEKHTMFAKAVYRSFVKSIELTPKERESLGSMEDILNTSYIAGGCITSLLLGEAPKDYDIFLREDTTSARAIRVCFSDIKSVGKGPNSATLTVDGVDLQLITTWSGAPENIVAGFDFVHCKSYFSKGKLVLDSEALESTLLKELVWTKAGNNATLNRMIRFLNRGWTIDPEVARKMMNTFDAPSHVNGEAQDDYQSSSQSMKASNLLPSSTPTER